MLQLCSCPHCCCCCISYAIGSANRQHAPPLLRGATCSCSCKHAFALETSAAVRFAKTSNAAHCGCRKRNLCGRHTCGVSFDFSWRSSVGRLQYTGRAAQLRFCYMVCSTSNHRASRKKGHHHASGKPVPHLALMHTFSYSHAIPRQVHREIC